MRMRASHFLTREVSSSPTTGVSWTTSRGTSLHHRVLLLRSREVEVVDIVAGGVLLQGTKERFL